MVNLAQRSCVIPMVKWTGHYWRESAFHWDHVLATITKPIPNLDDYKHPSTKLPYDLERHIFRQINALKYGLMKEKLPSSVNAQLTALYDFVGQRFYWLLVGAVDKLARRCMNADRDELFSVAGLVLSRCMHRFNYQRGRRFSTYLNAALHKRLWDDVYAQRDYQRHTPLDEGHEDLHDESRLRKSSSMTKLQVREQLSKLSLIERAIVKRRFGIGHPSDMTFETIGDMIGLPKQSVRLIFDRAMGKLKSAADRQP